MQPPSAQSQALDATCSAWLGRRVDSLPLGVHRLLTDFLLLQLGSPQMLACVCRLAVSEVRLALSDLDNIAIGIAYVTARLTILVLRLRDERGSPFSPLFIACLNIRNTDVHKAADLIGIGGDAERYRRFVGCWTAADVDNQPRVRDLNVAWRAAAITSAQNASSENRFVKSKGSFDVGDAEKECDGKPVLWRHLIAFLFDLYFVHKRLQFSCVFLRSPEELRDIEQRATGRLRVLRSKTL